MTQPFAQGKKAFGFCDKCSQRWLLPKLKPESVAGRVLSNRVCPDCWDADHPQNWQGRYPVIDPQALRNPRPDNALEESRDIVWGWNPLMGVTATGEVGTVTAQE
jgi:hypothetical protein